MKRVPDGSASSFRARFRATSVSSRCLVKRGKEAEGSCGGEVLRVPRIPVHYRCVILYQSRLIVSMTLSARMLRLDLLSISSDSKYAGTKALCKEKFQKRCKNQTARNRLEFKTPSKVIAYSYYYSTIDMSTGSTDTRITSAG